VGIVEDGPHNHLRERPTPYIYFPFAQRPVFYLTWMIHTSREPGDFAGAFRKSMRSIDSGFTLLSVHTFREHMRAARSDQEVVVQVAGSLAGVGLLLAAAGLFGVTLFAVAKRTPEFGVRAAMGASPRDLARQVLREAGIRVAIALPLGWGLAYAGRHAISKLLFGVAADDPWTFAGASAVVAVVASAAALFPALRAARIDPMTALRHE
jgi:ABC-type antimicrobial peptide transport system permease subunit